MKDLKTEFQTLAYASEGIFKDKGSKFLSFAFPVSSMEEIKSIVEKFKKEYFDARHICYAYALGPNREQYRQNDDGEPSGTAGKPIYGQILSAGITNCIVVVVRYFGGILLGTGGLITAYKEASLDAIRNSELITREITQVVEIKVDFLQLNELMKLIKDLNVKIIQQIFEMECQFVLEVSKSKEEMFVRKLKNIDKLTFSIKETEF